MLGLTFRSMRAKSITTTQRSAGAVVASTSWPDLAGHPRLAVLIAAKTWMAGTSMPLGGPQARSEGPAMTKRQRPCPMSRYVGAYGDKPAHNGSATIARREPAPH